MKLANPSHAYSHYSHYFWYKLRNDCISPPPPPHTIMLTITIIRYQVNMSRSYIKELPIQNNLKFKSHNNKLFFYSINVPLHLIRLVLLQGIKSHFIIHIDYMQFIHPLSSRAHGIINCNPIIMSDPIALLIHYDHTVVATESCMTYNIRQILNFPSSIKEHECYNHSPYNWLPHNAR